ncbi:putative toxin-antitoxin system, toxin component [Turicibacter sp. HGF1]|uniref:ImmA/IrrE family metallo-endopeptidase n=1 Tax=Turicibacter sp. HGF1 TaxID=910310 RepID=UPI0001FD99D0|nr:ImmA/IrrE family metallo-endopeptidase [Turicibacter sp. HGF1]EGC93281.1 putative toxin-antitoxin system, toxin component [Turicibacter sp. HGF1]
MVIDISGDKKREWYESAIPIARVERAKLLPDNEVISNPFQLLEKKGFFILKFPSKDDNLSGFHIRKSGIDCIYINSAQTLGRQYFSVWHEYYHAVTGEGSSLSFHGERELDEIEFKAECFAGCLLMPEELVKEYLKNKRITNLKYIRYTEIIAMQNYFKVSFQAIIKRLIQIFPEFENDLKKRYSLSKKERYSELIKLTEECHGDVRLITKTNDVYLSKQFFDDMEANFIHQRISPEKMKSLLVLLECLENES